MIPADVESVMRIARNLKDAPHWPGSVYQGAIDGERLPRRIALVAESGGKVLGFVVASVLPPQAELESIAVMADWQRRGIGRFLLVELAWKLKLMAVREILLEVRASNRAAREFYESAGWVQTGARPRYYKDPEEDAVLMSLGRGS